MVNIALLKFFYGIVKNYRDKVLENIKGSKFASRKIIVEVTTKPKTKGRSRS